jgi:hypothetical protein
MGKNHVLCFFLFVFVKIYHAMGLYKCVFAFDDLFPKRWNELNNLDMLKIYHLFLIRIFYCHHTICIFYKIESKNPIQIQHCCNNLSNNNVLNLIVI